MEKMMKNLNLGGRRKGQAVMEYLITYGLALFVILIVLAILVAVVIPMLQAPEACKFKDPGFDCTSKRHVLVSDTSNNLRLLFQLDNSQGRPVIVSGVVCSNQPPDNVRKADITALPSNVTMVAGESLNFTTPCLNQDKTNVVLPAKSTFQGSIGLLYNFQDEVSGAPVRVATATVSGTVQSE